MVEPSASTSSNPSAQSATPKGQRRLSDYILILKERWLLGFILGAIAGGALYYTMSQEVPLYTARATMQFELRPERILPLEEVSDPTLLAQGLEIGMANYLNYLRSADFMSRVVDSLTDEEWEAVVAPYREDAADEVVPIAIIRPGFSFMQLEGTGLLLSQNHRDPEMASFLVNRIVDEFSDFILTRSGRTNEAAISFLEAQVDDLRETVRRGELSLQEYRAANNIVSLEDSQNIVINRLTALNSASTAARINLVNARSRVREIELARERGVDLTQVPLVRNYDGVSAKIEEIRQTEDFLALLEIKYLDNHPDVVRAREALELESERRDQLVAEAEEFLRAQVRSAEQRMEDIQAELETVEQQAIDLDRTSIEHGVLGRALANDRSLFEQVLGRLNEARITNQLLRSPIDEIDRATIPGAPSSPDPTRSTIASIALFLTIFAGVPAFFVFVDTRIKGRSDIESFLGEEFLGEIPLIKTLRTEKLPVLFRDNTDPVFSEKVNAIRAKLGLVGKVPYPKVLVFSSALPEEGKSVVVNNLAFAFARHGVRTLLIDADMRTPTLHRSNQAPNEQGLRHLIEETNRRMEEHRDDYAVPAGIQNIAPRLDFLPSSGHEEKPTEVLALPGFGQFIEDLKSRYDLVLFDTPPAMLFSDAWQVAEFADEFVVVSRYNKVARGKLRLFLRSIRKTRTSLLGVIFNASPRSEESAFDYSYARRFREYGRERRRQEERENRLKEKKEASAKRKADAQARKEEADADPKTKK